MRSKLTERNERKFETEFDPELVEGSDKGAME